MGQQALHAMYAFCVVLSFQLYPLLSLMFPPLLLTPPTASQASDSAKRLRDLVENERKSPPRSSRETEDDKECQQVFRDF
jgi:hypothetical protein